MPGLPLEGGLQHAHIAHHSAGSPARGITNISVNMSHISIKAMVMLPKSTADAFPDRMDTDQYYQNCVVFPADITRDQANSS